MSQNFLQTFFKIINSMNHQSIAMNYNISSTHNFVSSENYLIPNDDDDPLFFDVDHCKFSMKIVCSTFLKKVRCTITISSN